MKLSTRLRLCIASAAFMLSLPSVAAHHEPTTKAPAGKTQTVVGRTVATTKPVSSPLASAAPFTAATAETPTGPQTVTLTGVVLRADGQPCAGASVYMSGAARQVVVTDSRGAFALPVPAGNPLALNAEYFGVGSTRVALDKPSTQPLLITIR